jgi:hypothetical protein
MTKPEREYLSKSDALPEWQRELLDERLAAGDDEPSMDWEDFKAELWPPSTEKGRPPTR